MTRPIRALGEAAIGLCQATGEMVLILLAALSHFRFWGRQRLRLGESFFQMLRLGVRSVPLVALVNFLVGAIMAISLSSNMQAYGVLEQIATVVGVGQTRELGPLMAALMMSGFAGAAIAAEIGTMAVSEELVALRAQALSPAYFLVAPRLAAMLVMMPCLVVVANYSGIVGGYVIGVFALGIDPTTYIAVTVENLLTEDILRGVLIKGEVFAILITLVACHTGLGTRGGAEGVGNGTTQAVVRSIVLIIAANLVLSVLFHYTLA